MNIKDLEKPLGASDIDFRVQSIGQMPDKRVWAILLAYKNARVDINRLNKVCGHLGWKREHSRDNKNCTVSIWDENNKHWVSKEDTGTESNTEQQKGLASDSFKRSCFNWGIGIELYRFPLLFTYLNTDEYFINEKKKDKWNKPIIQATKKLKLNKWSWNIIEDNNQICVTGKDQKNIVRVQAK